MSSPSPATYSNPPALIAFTLTIVVICFICFSLVYFSRCYFVSIIQTWAFHHSAPGTLIRLFPSNNHNNNNASSSSPFRGLDPSLLKSFPTFPYSSVKDLRKEETKKYSLECAICLVEFEDDSMLRLLTICRHVFHQDCVDLWLRSHKTCPVCRTDLETRQSHHDESSVVEEEDCGGGGEVCIDVKEGEREGREERFSRSHSTGHSIVMVRGGGDGLGRDGDDDDDDDDSRYTLRLQEHAIRLKVVRGGHNCTKSCATYKEMMMMVARPAAPCSNCGYVQTVSGCSSRIGVENVDWETPMLSISPMSVLGLIFLFRRTAGDYEVGLGYIQQDPYRSICVAPLHFFLVQIFNSVLISNERGTDIIDRNME